MVALPGSSAFPCPPPLSLLHHRYLWADMGVVLGFVLLVPTMAPRHVVQRGRPEPDLLSPTILRSVVGHTVIVIMFQVGFKETVDDPGERRSQCVYIIYIYICVCIICISHHASCFPLLTSN